MNSRYNFLSLTIAFFLVTNLCAVLATEPMSAGPQQPEHAKTILVDPRCDVEGSRLASTADSITEKDIKVKSARELHQIDVVNVQGLNITNVPIEDRDLAVLSKCRKLRRLYIGGTKVTNKGLLSLHLPQLERLFVSDTVDDDGFAEPSRFPMLQNLNLEQSRKFRGKGLSNVSKLPLKELSIYVPMADLQESALSDVQAESSVSDDDDDPNGAEREQEDLSRANLIEQDFSDLSNCSTLKILDIPGRRLNEKTLSSLPMNLEKLDLGGCRLPGSLQSLSHLAQLRELNLKGTHLGPDVSSTLAKLSNLEVLFVPQEGTLDQWLAGLQPLKHIRRINIDDFKLTENTGFLLSSFSNLDKLILYRKTIPNSFFQAIGGLEHLKYLDLSRSNFEDASPINWEKLLELKELSLGYTSVGNHTLTRLEGLPLEDLDLQFCTKISSTGLSSIAKLSELKSLELTADSNIGFGLEFLNLEKIESLKLAGTHINDAQLTHLKRLRNLSYLDISVNPGITKNSLNTLLGMWRLKHLDIHMTGLGLEGWTLLRRSLKGCSISYLKF